MKGSRTIGEYLIERLYAHGVEHIFGVPGDYALGFFHQLDQSKIKVVNTCDEQGAGFAADAYARIRGLGAVCVTYCVGGLKVANSTAQAYAEKSPVVIISGAPGTKERAKNPLLHHKVRDFDTQFKVFQELTVASTVLNDPRAAFSEIDRVLSAAIRTRRPVYIELPRDMVSVRGAVPRQAVPAKEKSDRETFREALAEAVKMINVSHRPVIIAGVELHRFGLQKDLLRLIQKTNIPVTVTPLSKAVLGEGHPRFLGVYEGAMGQEACREYVESSDCLILLGAFMSDVDLGVFTAQLDQARSISVTSEKCSIAFHNYEDIFLKDFIHGLIGARIKRRSADPTPHPALPAPFRVSAGKRITVARLFQRLNSFLDDKTVVIADPGDAMFAGADLFVRGQTVFLCPAYYTSMGFAVPASLGVQLANPKMRPLVLVGDGAFQMTGMELSTAARFKLTPIIVVLNNRGYGTERPMQDGAFNDIQLWNYSRLPEVLNAGRGFDVETEDQLEKALSLSREHKDSFCILDVHLDPKDSSPALKRFTASLGKRVHGALK
ncbi:MAG: alpha-keto acid decarboxylase family protein [Candidatus Omnitrophota bacterium]